MPSPTSAEPSPPGPPPAKKRRRPALACVQCRRRKIRCDQNTPCQNCVKAGISPCEIPPNHISTLRAGQSTSGGGNTNDASPSEGGSVSRREEGDSRGSDCRRDWYHHHHSHSAQTSEQPSHPIQNFEHHHSQLQNSEYHGPTARNFAGPSGTLTPGPTPRSDTSGAAVSGAQIEAMLMKIEGLERTVDKLQADIKADEEERRQAAKTRKDVSPGPRFGNQSSWLNDTVLYRTVLRTLKETIAEAPDSPLALHMKTCTALLQTIEGHLTMPSFISAPLGSRMPDVHTRRTLLDHYYSTYESIFRVLDVPIFEEEHFAYTQMADPSQAREIFVLQLQMCLALGSKSLHRQSEGNTAGIGDTLSYRNVANHWLCQAQSWLATKGKKQAITFEALQLYTLMTLYEAEDQGAEKPAWVLTGDLLRRAMCLNLNQDPKRLGETNYRKAELHRRLWATILELNLLMSVHTGQAPGISLSDYDTEPPLHLSDLQLGPTTIDPLHQDHILDTKFPLALFSSFPLRLQIATRCSQGRPPLSYQELLSFHRELDLAWGALAEASKGWYSLLTEHAHHLSRMILASQILALHLPIIGRYGIDDPMHLTSRIVAKTMSLAILEQIAPPSQYGEDQTIRNLFTSSGCLWRNVAVQAVFYLALEQCAISDEVRTQGLVSITSGDVSTIHSAMAIARDWVYDRIGMGMKDTHCNCFLAATHRMATDTSQPRDVNTLIVAGAADQAARCERKLTRLADETVKFAVREPTEAPGGGGGHEMAITGVMNPVVDMNWITEPFMGPYDEMLFGWTFDASMGGMML